MYSSTAVSSAAPSVCSQSPYAQFLPLRNFAPAETFCSIYLAQSTVPSTSGCPNGNSLCAVLSSLSKCDLTFISTVCHCIESGSTTTISVPTQSRTTSSTIKTTLKSSSVSSSSTPKVTSRSSSVKATSTTLATSSATTAAAPTCTDGLIAVVPPPDGATCQQRGLLTGSSSDLVGNGTATSVEDCDQQCMAMGWECSSFEYNPTTGACLLYFLRASNEGFVADDTSPFSVSDQICFQSC